MTAGSGTKSIWTEIPKGKNSSMKGSRDTGKASYHVATSDAPSMEGKGALLELEEDKGLFASRYALIYKWLIILIPAL